MNANYHDYAVFMNTVRGVSMSEVTVKDYTTWIMTQSKDTIHKIFTFLYNEIVPDNITGYDDTTTLRLLCILMSRDARFVKRIAQSITARLPIYVATNKDTKRSFKELCVLYNDRWFEAYVGLHNGHTDIDSMKPLITSAATIIGKPADTYLHYILSAMM